MIDRREARVTSESGVRSYNPTFRVQGLAARPRRPPDGNVEM